MKKVIKPLILFISTSLLTIGCQKEKITPRGVETNSHIESSYEKAGNQNDSYLIQVINSQNLDAFEKGNELISVRQLSDNVLTEFVQKANLFDQYVIEVVLSSQNELFSDLLTAMINNNSITDETLESILISKAPLDANIISELNSNQRNVDINKIQLGNKNVKIVSICANVIIMADAITTLNSCDETVFLLENASTIPLANSCIKSDSDKLRAAGGDGGWTKGRAIIQEEGDDTYLRCRRPPYSKCAKVIRKNVSLSNNEIGLLNTLKSSNQSDFQKGKMLLEENEISENLMSEIIDLGCSLDSYVMETVLMSSGKLSEDNLIKVMLSENFSDEMVKNILITNPPLSNRTEGYVLKLRPNLNLSEIQYYYDKSIMIALCCGQIFIGNSVTIEENGHNAHNISIDNESILSFANSISQNNLETMRQVGGGGNWIKGELSWVSENNQVSNYICSRPPNKRCAKVVKDAQINN